MAISWRTKRQLVFFAVFGVAAGAGLWILFSQIVPEASCRDRRQNQREEGVDCGGPCAPCATNARAPVILWTRFFQVSPGHFEAASLVENQNQNFGAKSASYRFRLYDAKNILIAAKEGKTFLGPGERFVVYEPDLATFQRSPVRATLEFDPISWAIPDREKPRILITNKAFSNDPAGRVRVELQNEGLFAVDAVDVAAVLLDAGGNAVGTSISRLERLEGEERREIFFTWRNSFVPPPDKIEVFWRVNRFQK